MKPITAEALSSVCMLPMCVSSVRCSQADPTSARTDIGLRTVGACFDCKWSLIPSPIVWVLWKEHSWSLGNSSLLIKPPLRHFLGQFHHKKLVPSKLNLQNGRKEMLRSIFMINKPTFRPERRRKFIHAAVIAWMKWTHKSSTELRFSTVFIKIQISLSVLMCCCLSNEWNAYDDDNSCLKVDEWSGVKHNGHLPGPEMPLLEIGYNNQHFGALDHWRHVLTWAVPSAGPPCNQQI